MKYLSAADILKQQTTRQNKRFEAFEHIVASCYKRIEKCVQVTRNVYSCFFEVPEFLIGYPLYDLNECIGYVVNILNSKGFTVQYMFPRVLMVSWLPKNTMTLPMPVSNQQPMNQQPTNQNHQNHTNHSVYVQDPAKKTRTVATPGKKVFVQKTGSGAGVGRGRVKPSGKIVLDLS